VAREVAGLSMSAFQTAVTRVESGRGASRENIDVPLKNYQEILRENVKKEPETEARETPAEEEVLSKETIEDSKAEIEALKKMLDKLSKEEKTEKKQKEKEAPKAAMPDSPKEAKGRMAERLEMLSKMYETKKQKPDQQKSKKNEDTES
jgi:hypothetical protein